MRKCILTISGSCLNVFWVALRFPGALGYLRTVCCWLLGPARWGNRCVCVSVNMYSYICTDICSDWKSLVHSDIPSSDPITHSSFLLFHICSPFPSRGSPAASSSKSLLLSRVGRNSSPNLAQPPPPLWPCLNCSSGNKGTPCFSLCI